MSRKPNQKAAEAEAVAEVIAEPPAPEEAAPEAEVAPGALTLLNQLRDTSTMAREERAECEAAPAAEADVERFLEQFVDGCKRAAAVGETAHAVQFIGANYQLSLRVCAALKMRGLPAAHTRHGDAYVVRADW